MLPCLSYGRSALSATLLFILGSRIIWLFYLLIVPVFIWRLGEFGRVVGFNDESFVAYFRGLGNIGGAVSFYVDGSDVRYGDFDNMADLN